jgi:YggT family protein
MIELLLFISQLISMYEFLIIAGVILSWLIGFGIVNPYNQIARAIWNFFQAITEPALRPIRAMLPDLGGIDVSPIVLLLALQFVQHVILPNIMKAFI